MLPKCRCLVCGKEYEGFGFACSEKCTKALSHIVGIVITAGIIIEILKELDYHPRN